MERQDVIKILESLAYGNDPANGARISAETFHSADTVRALFTAVAMMKDLDAAGRRRGRNNNSDTFAAAGTPWNKHEEARACQEFDKGLSIAQIALLHGRSSGAITTRLVKLGKIEAVKSKAEPAKAAS